MGDMTYVPVSAFMIRPGTFALFGVIPLTICLTFGFLLPLAGVVVQSVQNADGGWSLSGFRELLGGAIFPRVLVTTLETAAISTAITLAVAYPVALYLSRQSSSRRAILLSLVLVPFWTSILVKSFGFTIILGESGLIRGVLGIVFTNPPRLLFNRTGVVIGYIHFFVPYIVFPVLATSRRKKPDFDN
jgi:putative spermidine/putrescine transport system permease protein/mannopine transport system permease protein